MKNVLEMDDGDNNGNECHRTVHLKVVKMIHFMLCIFYNFKNKGMGTDTCYNIDKPYKTLS